MSNNTITAGRFSFSEQGFLCDLEPRCTQAVILKRLVVTPELVSLKWLRSQLAHYALKLSGNKDELEDRLKKAIGDGKLKTQPKEIRDMEKGLKAAFEARGGGGGGKNRGKIEKKKAPAAAPSKAVAAAAADTAKKPAPAAKKKKKGDAALHAAIAAATRKSHPSSSAASSVSSSARPMGSTAPKQPRVSFADNLLGTYAVSCSSFPYSDSSLRLYRHSLEPKLAGALDLGDGTVHAVCTLDWMPMAKQSRVPFSANGRKGEMEFSVDKGVVRVKGKMESGPWGEVEFVGLKGSSLAAADFDYGEEGGMDFAW